MIERFGQFEIDDDPARIDFACVQKWLANTYWSPGIDQETVEKAAQFSSLVVGVYRNPSPALPQRERESDSESPSPFGGGVGERTPQVGYLRVVSDRVRFAYLCDVYVDAAYRGQGLARAMTQFALAHPEHQNLGRWLLVTRDAHAVYRGVGFEPLPSPERWLAYLPLGPMPVDSLPGLEMEEHNAGNAV